MEERRQAWIQELLFPSHPDDPLINFLRGRVEALDEIKKLPMQLLTEYNGLQEDSDIPGPFSP
jgi:hypothetical protein